MKQALKRFWKWCRTPSVDSLDAMFNKEREYINENEPKALENLKYLGWTVLSTDDRIAFFSYRIQKGEYIHSVSLREALAMK